MADDYAVEGRLADGGGDTASSSVLPTAELGDGMEMPNHNDEWQEMPLPMYTEVAQGTHFSTDGSDPMPPMPSEPEIPRGTPTL